MRLNIHKNGDIELLAESKLEQKQLEQIAEENHNKSLLSIGRGTSYYIFSEEIYKNITIRTYGYLVLTPTKP